jgi:hypothetical protein
MIDQYPSYEVTESDHALALEFKRRPDALHRPDVVRLVNRILWAPLNGRVVLICTKSHSEWRLGRLSGVRGKPIEMLDEKIYTDRAEALWTAFELRWRIVTGKPFGDNPC